MESSEQKRSVAWQPITVRGVAAFAGASLARLMLVQFLVALLAALVVGWFVSNCWFPTIRTAIDRLPAQGVIQSGRLNWNADSPKLLAESRFLALSVDLDHRDRARAPAHFQVEFGRVDLRIYSLFGCLQSAYPKDRYTIPFNVEDLKPWWGAWAPELLGILVAIVLVGLLVSWALLAMLYCVPAWLLGLYRDRALSFTGSWRLAGAALMPGALLMTAAIGAYGAGVIDLVRLLVVGGAHIVVGWVYLLLATLAMPRVDSNTAPTANPFAKADSGPEPTNPPQKKAPSNPFLPKP